MSAVPRPNLGGLFNGSMPPDRSSGVSGAFEPRFLKQLPVDEALRDGPSETPPAAPEPADEVPSASPGEERRQSGRMDPARIVEQYFAFLQLLLDANRDFAVALTNTVMSLPKRGRR